MCCIVSCYKVVKLHERLVTTGQWSLSQGKVASWIVTGTKWQSHSGTKR